MAAKAFRHPEQAREVREARGKRVRRIRIVALRDARPWRFECIVHEQREG